MGREKRRVVVTGLGGITPIGKTKEETWQSVKNGYCGIGPITRYDTTGRKVTLAGEIKDYKPEDFLDKREARKMDRYTQFAMIAADQAVKDSGLDLNQENRDRAGVILSSGIGGLETIENEDKRGNSKGYDRVSPFFIPMCISNIAAGQIAIRHGLQGMCTCVVTACASSTNAVGDSFHRIRDGYEDIMLAGGAEACITPLGIGGFTALKALSESRDPIRASIPFDRERNGFVMGEGAAVLVLEEYEHAAARGAHIYCEIVGYGANCDAHHITAPLEDGSGAAKCMKLALADAGIAPEQVTYVNAHGTSTSLNDKGETKAVHEVFGDWADKEKERHLKVSSTKSMTGHLLGASGAVEALITSLCVAEDFVPATIHYRIEDSDCDLDIVPNKGIAMPVECAMSNSLGFGGHNASLVFRKV